MKVGTNFRRALLGPLIFTFRFAYVVTRGVLVGCS